MHPTQKPVKLYRLVAGHLRQAGMRVLDTHMGSGSIAIAAHYAGIHLTAYEIDADYFHAAKSPHRSRNVASGTFLPRTIKLTALRGRKPTKSTLTICLKRRHRKHPAPRQLTVQRLVRPCSSREITLPKNGIYNNDLVGNL